MPEFAQPLEVALSPELARTPEFAQPLEVALSPELAQGSRALRRHCGRGRRGAEEGAAARWEGSRGRRRRGEGAEGSRGARALVKRIRKEKEEFDIWDARVSGCGVG